VLDFLTAECSLVEAELLTKHIGKVVLIDGNKCIIVNVARRINGRYKITVRKLRTQK